MCAPVGAVAGVVSAISAVASAAIGTGAMIAEQKQQKKNNEYRAQIAINQINNSRKEAQRQIQLGIEESRAEKIKGLKAVSQMAAKNASNGFDAFSGTNLNNYQNVFDEHKENAKNIMDSYNYNAEKYSNQAQSYKNEFINESSNYNSLGSTLKAAQRWYNNDIVPAAKAIGGLNGSFKTTNS